MKTCSRCKIELPPSSFYKDRRTKSGLYSECKNCRPKQKSTLELVKEEPTPSRVVTLKWCALRGRCGRYPAYLNTELRLTRNEMLSFIEITWDEYLRLYNDWKLNGFPDKLSPSIDRIDPNGHYEIGNIQWLTLGDNVRRAMKGRPKTAKQIAAMSRARQKYLAEKLNNQP